ncbi:MAG TPA: SDR family oxidoreductase [Bryobacteraceae bacterium]|jgi:NAD(P)-dependent dehydrogenase (short-subunit alcohol dehydrogenase family)|nr:SDR family oxidoreductase [Bryobacteraceae bacterium]
MKTQRIALVTGAAQGIGRRTSELLAARGYALVLNDLRPMDVTKQGVRAFGPPVLEILADVSNEKEVGLMVDRLRVEYGRLDVLVNNAGISCICPAEQTTLDQWRRVLDVNLTGPFLMCQAFGRLMLQQGEGAIVNVASIAGLAAVADRAAYNASKHGLIGLTRTLAAEWGGRGVRCNAVCPGWVKTEMDMADQAGGGYTDADIKARVPMGRFADPEDIAQAIAFLADPKLSGFVNGHALQVDGGWLNDASWDSLRLRKK